MPFTNALCFFYLNRLVFILFLLLLLSLFDCLLAFFQETVGTRKTSARAARGIARENEARDYSARLPLQALFAFTRPIIAKK